MAGRVGVSFPLGAIDRSKSSAENQIAELKQQLAKLQAAQTAGQAVGPDNTDLVNTLRAEINSLQLKLAEQDARFQKMMEQIRTLLPGGPNKSRQMSSRS